jgi:hypothetical protein
MATSRSFSELVSLIEHVQAGMKQLEAAADGRSDHSRSGPVLLRYGVEDDPGRAGIAASPPRSRPQAPISASFDVAFARFFLFFPFRKETSISAPLTRTSSHRR